MRIESFSKTLILDIYLDHEFFERATGSGICVSSQAGSTAVNRALNGAVIDSGLEVMQLCEIMPISHKNHHSLRKSVHNEHQPGHYDFIERAWRGACVLRPSRAVAGRQRTSGNLDIRKKSAIRPISHVFLS